MTKTRRSRSHYGCINCKNRKVKCGEEKPICKNCLRLRLACRYSNTWSRRKRERSENENEGTSESEQSVHPDDLLATTKSRSITYEFLMYHYCTNTAPTLVEVSGDYQGLFAVEYPKKGFKYRFLLDAIYLLSSAHLNHLKPCHEYQQYMLHFNTLAVSGLRTQLDEVVKSNDLEVMEAVAMTSSLLSIYSLTCDSDTPFTGLSGSLMSLFKGMRTVFAHLWPHRDKTGFKVLDDYIDMHSKTKDLGGEYIPDIERVFELQKTNIDTYKPIIESLASMTHVFANEDTKIHRKFHMSTWIISLSPEFLQLTDNFDACALVLLARYFYILSTDKSWFFGDYAYKHYLRVYENIPPHWKSYVELLKDPPP
ncbi:hypothetical protein TRICI_003988 [Trichomonascus ciferrii]|uniref:Zn(2)-C6 fungal-type domain-containing protein n=1 Tax=Trichomonascus ciferrii TaxID=44093 RepID=A0A642V3L8_9ASCO|nr:hypothetical protein TRICI_003988 [Trichomonascus ciferrii]